MQGIDPNEVEKQKTSYPDIIENHEDTVGEETIHDSLEELADLFDTSGDTLSTKDERNPQLNTKN